MSTDYEVAGILVFEFGRKGAIKYARKIANNPGELSAQYHRVAVMLLEREADGDACHQEF